MTTYWVRCNLSATGSYMVSIWDAATTTATQIIDIDAAKQMMIELKTDDANSDPQVRGFALSVKPDKPSEVDVKPISKFDIQINDHCSAKNDVNLHASVTLTNNYVIDSGKPIIRNRPAQPVQWVLVATIVVIAVAAVIAIAHYGFGVDLGFGRAP